METPNTVVLILLFIIPFGLILSNIYRAKYRIQKGKTLFIRKIPGLDSIDEAIGRATEMGRPVSFATGLGSIDLDTLAAVSVLNHVTKLSAQYGVKTHTMVHDPLLFTIVRELTKEVYTKEGKPDDFSADNLRYIPGNQFSYAAGVMGVMHREKVAASFIFGLFAAEALIISEAGQQVGAIQIAGTTSFDQIPFFITTCDYTIIGEELFAAQAYFTKEPVQMGSLVGQDFSKILILIIIVLGTIAATMGKIWGYPNWISDLICQNKWPF